MTSDGYFNQESSLAAYFRERLDTLGRSRPPAPHEDTVWYLSTMLERFGHTDQLFCPEDSELALRPLALLYSDAQASSTPRERTALLKRLGDLSLFLGALFPELFAKRGIRKDYLVGMGGGAYEVLAETSPQHSHVFSELAATFTKLLNLVSQACCREHFFDAQDIISLHQRWLKSKDPLAEKQLRAVGIIPFDTGNP